MKRVYERSVFGNIPPAQIEESFKNALRLQSKFVTLQTQFEIKARGNTWVARNVLACFHTICSGMLTHRSWWWTLILHTSFNESWNTDRWRTGGLSIVSTDSKRLWQIASRCVLSTLFAFPLFVPYLTQNRRNTDAIITNSTPRHHGTPEKLDATAYTHQRHAPCRRYCFSIAVWSQEVGGFWFYHSNIIETRRDNNS